MATTTIGTWIYDKGSATGGGGGGGGGVPAPDVSILPSPDVVFRSDHKVEVDVAWLPDASATPQNFLGVQVYLEDPDISSAANGPMDGTSVTMDGTTNQMSGDHAPIPVNEVTKSPATVFLDSTMGTTNGQTYKTARNVRIYLASYGPYSHPHLVRATDPNPTPNILVNIPIGRGSGESGQEWAFLVTDVKVEVNTDYNRVDPKYSLILSYTPPDPATPVPPGMNHFGGCRIKFIYEDANGDGIFTDPGGGDTGMNIPVGQASGFKSDDYPPNPAGGKFRVYFCSEDDSQPLGHHVNSLIEGTTPFAYAIVPPVPQTPNVSNFTISGQKISWLVDGSMIAEALFSWDLGDALGNVRYAGVILYLVKVTGAGTNLTTFPQDLTGKLSNKATDYPMDISAIPKTPEVWTIAAISYDNNGHLADGQDPKNYGLPIFTSPTVTWTVGPPTPGSDGSGTEFAPLVTVNPGVSVTPTESISADGVGLVSFAIGSPTQPAWTNPDDTQFGNVQVGMAINHDATHLTYWNVPVNNQYFTTPAMPSFGNFGQGVPVDFYLVSDDPQGHKNKLRYSVTPVINYTYTPKPGAIIPARSGWFDDKQFSWVDGAGLTADNIEANNIYVGKTLVVGGSNDTSFAGQANGQIAVKNSSGQLRAWMGEQQPNQGMSGPPLWGAWFGQAWIGGTSPLDAPLWVDNQGIIQVGGIAARQNSRYPYISVRDQTGLEMGRIGASLNVPSGSIGDNTGSSPPPQLTAGAWFTQLAVGGRDLSNWNILIVPDQTGAHPNGSTFQMRNISVLTIDYLPQVLVQPYNNHYTLEFGSSEWVTVGPASWQFPGIHIYEVDSAQVGAYYLNRGLVLTGSAGQGKQVKASLVTYNGDASGRDTPQDYFWGELAMYSPGSNARTVYLASGGQSGQNSPVFILLDVSQNLLFEVDPNGHTYIKGVLQGAPIGGNAQPVNAFAYSVNGYGQVIGADGSWKGKAITAGGGQTPWATPINGNQQPLTNAGSISANQFTMNSGVVVVDTNGAFRGVGVDVGNGGITCGAITTFGAGAHPNTTNGIDTQTINCNGNIAANGIITARDHYEGGQFRGAGVSVPGYGIGCGYLNLNSGNIDGVGTLNAGQCVVNNYQIQNRGVVINSAAQFVGNGISMSAGITCGSLQVTNGPITCGTCGVNGPVTCTQVIIGTTQRIDVNGIYRGGLQGTDHVYGGDFGVSFVAAGLPHGGFYDRDGVYHRVEGGIICS
jgi:hypothetical protein